ncbi:MAG: TIGR02147 family protein [Bdellovibrionales bacterium]
MVLEHKDYRTFLKSELASRITKNPSYSLRAFASHLGISPAMLSLVLSGKKNLTSDTALRISTKLNFSSQEAEYLNLLVQIGSIKNMDLKEKLITRANELNPRNKRTDLSMEYFRVIADWYHFPIIALTELKGFNFKPINIAKRLGISKFEAEAALERLIKLEFLEIDPENPKRYRQVKANLLFQSEQPNEALQRYNRQILEKAMESIGEDPKERLIGSEIVAISKSHLKEANKVMEEFFSKILMLAQKGEKKSDVYCATVQFFNLTKNQE